MRRLALAAVCIGLAALPAQAQDQAQPDPQDIFAAFERLLGAPDTRVFFGLPPDRFWRPQGPVSLAVDPGPVVDIVRVAQKVAKLLSDATGHEIDVADTSGTQDITVAKSGESFELVVGGRQALAKEAFEKKVSRAALERFETGTWPFVFVIPDRTAAAPHNGHATVYLADDEPPRALEASMWLIAVWALGGVTLGPELQCLVDPEAEEPALTPLGEAVFDLLYDPRLEPGLPIAEVKARARQIMDD